MGLRYGGHEVTFSQDDFYKVNQIIYPTFFYTTFMESNESCFQSYAPRLL